MVKFDDNKRFYYPVGGALLVAIIIYFSMVSGNNAQASIKEKKFMDAKKRLIPDAGVKTFDASSLEVFEAKSEKATMELAEVKNRFGFKLPEAFKQILATKESRDTNFQNAKSKFEQLCKRSRIKITEQVYIGFNRFTSKQAKVLVPKLALAQRFVESLKGTGIKEVKSFSFQLESQASLYYKYKISTELIGDYNSMLNWLGKITEEGSADGEGKAATCFFVRSLEIISDSTTKGKNGALGIRVTFSIIQNDTLLRAEEVKENSGEETKPKKSTRTRRRTYR